MQSRLLTIREQWLLFGVAGAIVLGAAVLIWRGNAQSTPESGIVVPQPDGNVSPVPAPTPKPAPPILVPEPDEPEEIGVGVLGAVRDPGLYYFEPGARVADLLERAGGALPESDLSDINRTARLIDETTLLVPEFVEYEGQTYSYPATTYNPPPYTRSAWYRLGNNGDNPQAGGSGQSARAGANATSMHGGLININTATQAELETLPGVGPATALKIIAYREGQPFTTPADLEKVSGIGPAKMAAVRNLITVE